MNKPYGYELILDMYGCNKLEFTRNSIEAFFHTLCTAIDMKREDLHFWDYAGDPEGCTNAPAHLKGISAVQFISTSNITIHTLDVTRTVYLNIFSCKKYDPKEVQRIAENWFKATEKSTSTFIKRK